ncbi:MAG: hypothetical protein JOS17DRAFT_726662 [Linnemannia elongata]|nr:MAG: hypothetical protein JOS17DRAFT_726662 [Linnemannia elongata]
MAASAVVSGALFVGKDTTDPSASPSDIFRDSSNHAAAAASVLVFSGRTASFHPAEQESKSLAFSLDGFLSKAKTFPGFIYKDDSHHKFELDGSLEQLEGAISNSLGSSETARALRDLVPGNLEDEDQSLKDWVLSLIVLTKLEDTDDVEVRLAQLYLTIDSDGNSATIPRQTARLDVSDLQVARIVLVNNAERLATSITITSVSDFIQFFTSPKSFSRGSTSCFGTRQTFKDRQAILSWLH